MSSLRRAIMLLFLSGLQLFAWVGTGSAQSLTDLTMKAPPQGLHIRPPFLDTTNSYFAIAGSFKTKNGAMRHLADIRKRDMEIVAGVFPPYGRSKYWIVATASYAALDEARVQASYARRSGLQADAFAWRMPSPSDRVPRVYDVVPESVALEQYPSFLKSPKSSADPSGSFFVFLIEKGSQDDAEAASQKLLDIFPGIPVGVFPPRVNGDPWRVALAAHSSEQEAQQAVLLARRLGIVENAEVLHLSAPEALPWRLDDRRIARAQAQFRDLVESCFRDGSVTMGAMRACSGAWITPQALQTCIGQSITNADPNVPRLAISDDCVAIPDTAEGALILAKHGWDVATKLILEQSNYLKVENTLLDECLAKAQGNAAELQKCALSKLFTPSQTAALECMKRGGPDDVATCFRTAALASGIGDSAQAVECLRTKGNTLESAAACLPPDQQALISKMLDLQRCTSNVRNEREFRRKCLPALAQAEDVRTRCVAESGGDATKLRECAINATPGGRAILDQAECLKKAAGDSAAVAACLEGSLGGMAASVAACISRPNAGGGMVECLTKDDKELQKIHSVLECVNSRPGDVAAAFGVCSSQILPESSQKLASCLLATGVDPMEALSRCGDLPADATRIAESVACVQASTGPDVARCLVRTFPNRNSALETILCAQDSGGETAKLAACAATQVKGTGGAVVACLASQPEGSRDPLGCIGVVDPRLAQAQKVYECVQKTGDPAALIESCSKGLLDDRTRTAAACVARSNGDRGALAACAGQSLLPGEAGRLVGCAASSQGAASFAICAAAPSINEEWRIAGECAVSSGGEPISFATCTGGRLTIRELGKCLTGKFGKDCFGPNNTIVKYYTNMWNDLTKGPGPNNEVVKVVNAVGKGIEHLGQEAGKELSRREENARKRFEKPLDQPGKTFECIVTFGNSC